ncbi:hypothetical protein [Micromonospora sp. NPDC023633]|uniref:hypothetical protein n=1 Tax=Micromonospora sp. NPDC023633 TaxID=3154320 RepID=UPI0033FA7A3F
MTIWVNGHEYGTASEVAVRLGEDITEDRVRDWARRSRNTADPLHGQLPAHHVPGRGRGTTWYRLDQAAAVEAITRKTPGGPPRAGMASSASS